MRSIDDWPMYYAFFSTRDLLFLYSGSAVCFAFGQTGAGKTHTLLGTKSHPGLYRLAAGDLFSMMRQYDEQLTAIVSYYEIYCNRVYDLLNKRKRFVCTDRRRWDPEKIGDGWMKNS